MIELGPDLGALHPTLAVSIGLDEAGIDSKTFTADQPFGHTTAHHSLEHVPKYIAVTETAMTVLGEGRMVRQVAVEANRQNHP